MARLPTLDAHEELVRLAERRLARAADRLGAILVEKAEAHQALKQAREDRAEWVKLNPDPQMMMF